MADRCPWDSSPFLKRNLEGWVDVGQEWMAGGEVLGDLWSINTVSNVESLAQNEGMRITVYIPHNPPACKSYQKMSTKKSSFPNNGHFSCSRIIIEKLWGTQVCPHRCGGEEKGQDSSTWEALPRQDRAWSPTEQRNYCMTTYWGLQFCCQTWACKFLNYLCRNLLLLGIY